MFKQILKNFFILLSYALFILFSIARVVLKLLLPFNILLVIVFLLAEAIPEARFYVFFTALYPILNVILYIMKKTIITKPINFHKTKKEHISEKLSDIDTMVGLDFEHYCADILRQNDFKNVEVTQSTGDFGVDIIAYKGKLKYAIQCKRYSGNLGNAPIQEVVAGMSYYKCQRGAVITNSHFTESAKKLARANNVALWDREVLESMLAKCEKIQESKVDKKIETKETSNEHYSERAEYAQKLKDYEETMEQAKEVAKEEQKRECAKLLHDYTVETAEYISKFCQMNNYNLEIVGFIYEDDQIIYEVDISAPTRAYQISQSLSRLADYINVKSRDIKLSQKFVKSKHLGLSIPVPEYIKVKIMTIIA